MAAYLETIIRRVIAEMTRVVIGHERSNCSADKEVKQ